jgi:hypothetical protein
MTIKEYLTRLKKQERKKAFAVRCGTTLGYLQHLSSGYRKPGGGVCIRIHIESGYQILLHDIRPDFYPYYSFSMDPLQQGRDQRLPDNSLTQQ